MRTPLRPPSPPCIHFLSLSILHHHPSPSFFNTNPSTLYSPLLNSYCITLTIPLHAYKILLFSSLHDFFAMHSFYKTIANCLCGYFYDFFYSHNHLDTMSAHHLQPVPVDFFIILLRCQYKHCIANYQFRVL